MSGTLSMSAAALVGAGRGRQGQAGGQIGAASRSMYGTLSMSAAALVGAGRGGQWGS